MEKPSYVLDTEEAILLRKPQDKDQIILKIILLVVIISIAGACIALKKDLLAELGWAGKGALILIVVGLLFWRGKKVYVSSPMEIQFYQDYLIINRSKHSFKKKARQTEVDKFMYCNVKKLVFNPSKNRMQIHGSVDEKFYTYNSSEDVPMEPINHKSMKNSHIKFCLSNEPFVDIVSQIESNSPLQVRVQN